MPVPCPCWGVPRSKGTFRWAYLCGITLPQVSARVEWAGADGCNSALARGGGTGCDSDPLLIRFLGSAKLSWKARPDGFATGRHDRMSSSHACRGLGPLGTVLRCSGSIASPPDPLLARHECLLYGPFFCVISRGDFLALHNSCCRSRIRDETGLARNLPLLPAGRWKPRPGEAHRGLPAHSPAGVIFPPRRLLRVVGCYGPSWSGTPEVTSLREDGQWCSTRS